MPGPNYDLKTLNNMYHSVTNRFISSRITFLDLHDGEGFSGHGRIGYNTIQGKLHSWHLSKNKHTSLPFVLKKVFIHFVVLSLGYWRYLRIVITKLKGELKFDIKCNREKENIMRTCISISSTCTSLPHIPVLYW